MYEHLIKHPDFDFLIMEWILHEADIDDLFELKRLIDQELKKAIDDRHRKEKKKFLKGGDYNDRD